MIYFKPLTVYQPFSERSIVSIRVFIAVLAMVSFLTYLQLPMAAMLILMATLMLNCKAPELIKYMHWQLLIGFSLGCLFGLLFCHTLENFWFLVVLFSLAWALFWCFIGELNSLLLVPARIISIVPITMLVMVNAGIGSKLTLSVEVLILMSWAGVFFYKLISILAFPYNNTSKPQVPAESQPNFMHALQYALAILIILGCHRYFDLPSDESIITALVSIAVVSTAISNKLHSSILTRISGNLCGAAWAMFCLFILSIFPFTWLMIAISAFSFALFAYVMMTRLSWTGMGLQAGYAFIAVNPALAISGDTHSGLMRLLGVILGCLSVLISHWCLHRFLTRNQDSLSHTS